MNNDSPAMPEGVDLPLAAIIPVRNMNKIADTTIAEAANANRKQEARLRALSTASRYRINWTPELILRRILERERTGLSLKASVVRRDAANLAAAARRHFGSWNQAVSRALEAAKRPDNTPHERDGNQTNTRPCRHRLAHDDNESSVKNMPQSRRAPVRFMGGGVGGCRDCPRRHFKSIMPRSTLP